MIEVSEPQRCLLCGSRTVFFCHVRENNYYQCRSCRSVMLDPAAHPSLEKEKQRYDKHVNDTDDPGYRNFVRPLVDEVGKDFSPAAEGLDFGAGPGPVAAVMLGEEGYRIKLYDIYYHLDRSVFDKNYDYIICSEVIEHFRLPAVEFRRLRGLLRPGGRLYCMTAVYTEEIDFENWPYKDDPTHLFFYNRLALKWIQENIGFSELLFKERLIIYRI